MDTQAREPQLSKLADKLEKSYVFLNRKKKMPEHKFLIGQLVQVKLGASLWMKHHNYWNHVETDTLDCKQV